MHLFLTAVLEHCNNADCASEKQHAPQEEVGAVTGVGYIGVEHRSVLGVQSGILSEDGVCRVTYSSIGGQATLWLWVYLVCALCRQGAESVTYFTVCFRNTGSTLHLLWEHRRWDRIWGRLLAFSLGEVFHKIHHTHACTGATHGYRCNSPQRHAALFYFRVGAYLLLIGLRTCL